MNEEKRKDASGTTFIYETPKNKLYIKSEDDISSLKQPPPTTLIKIRQESKKQYKENYTLRGRIGIFILRVLGVVTLKIDK